MANMGRMPWQGGPLLVEAQLNGVREEHLTTARVVRIAADIYKSSRAPHHLIALW